MTPGKVHGDSLRLRFICQRNHRGDGDGRRERWYAEKDESSPAGVEMVELGSHIILAF
jgi:hypothetical protein